MNLQQLTQKVLTLTQQYQLMLNLAKKISELPEQNPMVPESEIHVFRDNISERLKISTLINSTEENNLVITVVLGTETQGNSLENILDSSSLFVNKNEIVLLSVLKMVGEEGQIPQTVQRIFLWKLGKGDYSPIGSENIDSKLFELPSIYPSQETADDLANAPDAVVRTYGTFSGDILERINTRIPSVGFTDATKIYYVRATIDGTNYLWQFTGENGTYGSADQHMETADLLLIFSSAQTGNAGENNYIQKNVYNETTAYAGDGKLYVQDSANYILLDPSITEIKGLVLGNSTNNFSGRPAFFTNKTGHDVVLRNQNPSVDIPLIMPSNSDYTIRHGFTVAFISSSDGDVEGSLRFIASGTNLQTVLDGGNTAISNMILESADFAGMKLLLSGGIAGPSMIISSTHSNGNINFQVKWTGVGQGGSVVGAGNNANFTFRSGESSEPILANDILAYASSVSTASLSGKQVPDVNFAKANFVSKTGNVSETITGNKEIAGAFTSFLGETAFYKVADPSKTQFVQFFISNDNVIQGLTVADLNGEFLPLKITGYNGSYISQYVEFGAGQSNFFGNINADLGRSFNCYTKNYGMGTRDQLGLQFYSADLMRFGRSEYTTVFTEQMRLDLNNGNLMLGGPFVDNGNKLQVDGNASISGAIKIGQFTDGTEPAYELGKTYFNTSINKMKIGGASVWETITSS